MFQRSSYTRVCVNVDVEQVIHSILHQENNHKGLGLVTDTVRLREKEGKRGEDPCHYWLPAVSFRSKLLPVDRTNVLDVVRTCLLGTT